MKGSAIFEALRAEAGLVVRKNELETELRRVTLRLAELDGERARLVLQREKSVTGKKRRKIVEHRLAAVHSDIEKLAVEKNTLWAALSALGASGRPTGLSGR